MESKYLAPTRIIDSDHPDIRRLVDDLVSQAGKNPVDQAVRLYYWARDQIWYDPYCPFHLPEHYQASRVLNSGRGFCIPKASLLCAFGRAANIASRVGFAAVRNHVATRELKERMGTDIFDWHGFVEFYLEGRWVRCTPAFNAELCSKFNIAPLEFNGRDDSIFHEYNNQRQLFMTYDKYYGTYDDIPVDEILAGWKKTYGEARVMGWIIGGKSFHQGPAQDFAKEELLQPD